jgi:hypothetical protein
MQEQVTKGDVAVSDQGDVIIVTRTNVRSENLDNAGRVHTYHTGTVLRSRNAVVGSRYAGKILRTVCSVETLLRFAERAGFDLTTPAVLPDSELTTVELLQKQVALLQAAVKSLSPEDAGPAVDSQVVQRPQATIASLHTQQ